MNALIPLFFDIESIPGQRPDIRQRYESDASGELAMIDADLKAELESIAPPANIKDPEKITDWWVNKAPEKKAALMEKAQAARVKVQEGVDEKWRKTALSGALGQVVVIGLAMGDDIPMTLAAGDLSAKAEADLLRSFFSLIEELCRARGVPTLSLRWVGHNSAGFDIRFIFQRCVVLGVRIPRWFVTLIASKPWESERNFDTMVQWAGTKDRISMDNLCFALGIEGKGSGLEAEGIDGSKVWDFVRDGRINEVATYCEGDIERTRSMYQRIVDVTEYSIE
ncbi:MAG: hypothetical protein ACK5PF_04575 [bacterium]|jgi:predicted PolB exonuclease-like 3'-5' exonuclease